MVQPVLAKDEKINNPATIALAALAVLAVLPLFLPIPANLNIVLTASLCVFTGCWRSVKATPPADSMSRNDAMTFPLIGSAVLLGLFLLFKFLPKELVNSVLTGYFVLIGIFAVMITILPFVDSMFPAASREKRREVPKITVPYLLKEPLDLSFTLPELAAGLMSSAFCIWYFTHKHWLANNVLGLAFSVQGIEHLSLGATTTGVILLSGLFFYDIFWVFCTPVMVSVAKSFDAPIKLLFPRAMDLEKATKPFSMLGLGDIVIPGIFVALLLRYDALQHFKTGYFHSAFSGYVLGLATTIVVMNVFEAAQPALLYIVPAVIGAVAAHAAYRNEFQKVLAFSEAKETKLEGKNEEDAMRAEDEVDTNVASQQADKKTL